MKIFHIIAFFLMNSIALNAFASEIFTNELCGGSSKNNRPCHYVKKINFHLDYRLNGKEPFGIVSKYLEDSVLKMNKQFSFFDIKVNFNPVSGYPWGFRKKENKSDVEITILFAETDDKKFNLITFYTLSKFTYYINTSQCPLNDNGCVVGKMQKFIDEIVVRSITQNGD